MKASLDTNVIIHLYRAGLQGILFDIFKDGVFIYEQIRYVELENHGKDVIPDIDKDIDDGKIELYTPLITHKYPPEQVCRIKNQYTFTVFSNACKSCSKT